MISEFLSSYRKDTFASICYTYMHLTRPAWDGGSGGPRPHQEGTAHLWFLPVPEAWSHDLEKNHYLALPDPCPSQ